MCQRWTWPPHGWNEQHRGGPLDALTDIGPRPREVQALRDRTCRLAGVGNRHEPPEVTEVLVANLAVAWLTKSFADLGALGQDEGRDLRDVDLPTVAGRRGR